MCNPVEEALNISTFGLYGKAKDAKEAEKKAEKARKEEQAALEAERLQAEKTDQASLIKQAFTSAKKKRAAVSGRRDTMLSGPSGTYGYTSGKKLLGE